MQSELAVKGDVMDSTSETLSEKLSSNVCGARETTAKAFNICVKLVSKKGRPKKSMSPRKVDKMVKDRKSLPLSAKRIDSDVVGSGVEPGHLVTAESDKPVIKPIIKPDDTKNLKAKQRAKMSLSPTRLLPTSIVDYFQPVSNKSSKRPSTPEDNDKLKKDLSPANETSPLGSSDGSKLRSRGRPRKSVPLDSIKVEEEDHNNVKSTVDEEVPQCSPLTNTIAVKMPKARKTMQRKPESNVTSERQHLNSLTSTPHMTIHLGELESALGIKQKSLNKLDAKTLDKIFLETAHKIKLSSEPQMVSVLKSPMMKPKGRKQRASMTSPVPKNMDSFRKFQAESRAREAARLASSPKATLSVKSVVHPESSTQGKILDFHSNPVSTASVDNSEEQQIPHVADGTPNFATILTGQKILCRRKKRKRRGTYKLPQFGKCIRDSKVVISSVGKEKSPSRKKIIARDGQSRLVTRICRVGSSSLHIIKKDGGKASNSSSKGQIIPDAVENGNIFLEGNSSQRNRRVCRRRQKQGISKVGASLTRPREKQPQKVIINHINSELSNHSAELQDSSAQTPVAPMPVLMKAELPVRNLTSDLEKLDSKLKKKRPWKRKYNSDEMNSQTSVDKGHTDLDDSLPAIKDTEAASCNADLPSLSPVTTPLTHGETSAAPPVITPHKLVSATSLMKSDFPWQETNSNEDGESNSNEDGESSVQAFLSKDCHGHSKVFGESNSHGRIVCTPNGVTYPVTPPHTPEHTAECRPEMRQVEAIPLCTCRMTGVALTGPKRVYCQALDSIDGKVQGCVTRVTSTSLVRPATKIPFLAVCDLHLQRLQAHQCCPTCGIFCAQGEFLQCCKDSTNGMVHVFHDECHVSHDNKYYCPHCGAESDRHEMSVKLKLQRSCPLAENIRLSRSEKAHLTKQSRMSFDGATKSREIDNGSVDCTVSIDGSNHVLSTKELPLGPAKEELVAAMAVIAEEKPKKMRTGVKSVFVACRTGDIERVLFMLSDGCDPNMRCEDHDNQTPLHAAAGAGNLLITHLLLQAGAIAHMLDDALYTPLMLAAQGGHCQVLQLLLKVDSIIDFKGTDGMTSLHLAAKSGKIDAVHQLVDTKKIDINIKDEGGWTPMIWAAEHRHVEVVRYLLSVGSKPNLRDNEENIALHWAALSGSANIAEIFLNAGCDLEAVNENGDRPLHIAARQDHYECVVLFLARGADSQARNNNNEAPISCCLDQSSPVWMALRVNRQLKGIAASKLHPTTRLTHRDISLGRENNPIPVVNAVDDDQYPQDFLYVSDYVETAPMNVNRLITSLQSCRCRDNCSSAFCVCSHNSVRCWYDKEGRLSREFNFSDPPLLFECNKACRCWTSCTNRVVQLGITCRLQVFRTPNRGWGCQTLTDIPQGSFVCEYIGELISDADADSREDDSYLFDLDNKECDTYCIDARRYGNISRFVNHRCEPNLVPVKLFVDHQDLRFPRICFFANKDIKAYEELGFDYGDRFWIIKWKDFLCGCGSQKCRYNKDTIQQTIQQYNSHQIDGEEKTQDSSGTNGQ